MPLVNCFDLTIPPRGDAGSDVSGDGGAGAGGDAGDANGSITDFESCNDSSDCESGNCVNKVCCAPGAVCCNQDSHCVNEEQHLACDGNTNQCYEQCGPDGEDHDERCAEGYHCDANKCFENIAQGGCDEDSDCVSGECIDRRYCCQHAGLCCAVDDDCPDMFDGCATDNSQTCVFSTFRIPDTGQRLCFDVSGDEIDCADIRPGLDYYGQDGHYPGLTRSYDDLGDGTVRDNVTGLLWARSASDQMKFDAAEDHCIQLTLAGKPGWRLPKRHELQSLVDYGAPGTAAIDPSFDLPDEANLLFWTGTPLAVRAGTESSTAWIVDFGDGTVIRTGMDDPDPRVLCVID